MANPGVRFLGTLKKLKWYGTVYIRNKFVAFGRI